jgi:hypothetical protein
MKRWILDRPSLPRSLLLQRAERPEVAVSVDDLLDDSCAECADQLVLEIRVAHVEAQALHVGACEVGTEAGALESPPELALLSGVTESRQRDVEAARAEPGEEAADRLRTADRHDADALGGEIAAVALGERLERDTVADSFDEHDCTGRFHVPYLRSAVVTIDEVCAFARTLPRSSEAFVRGRVKFRIGRIVWLSFSRDGTVMGFAFPKAWRDALVESEPEKFSLPSESDMRYHWVHVRLDQIDRDEMIDLVENAWALCVPKRVADDYATAQGYPSSR